MRKILFITAMFAISYFVHSQITKIPVKPITNKVPEKNSVYDSTRNYLKEDVKLYIGQTLYVKGSKEVEELKGYFYFYNYIPLNNNIIKKKKFTN